MLYSRTNIGDAASNKDQSPSEHTDGKNFAGGAPYKTKNNTIAEAGKDNSTNMD